MLLKVFVVGTRPATIASSKSLLAWTPDPAIVSELHKGSADKICPLVVKVLGE